MKHASKPLRAILWLAVSDPKQAAKDKESLPDQEARLTALAEREGWNVIDVIRIPGFSRDYYTFREFADDAASGKDPIRDPLRMFDHWSRQDFDVFACYDGTRFGREQSIFAEVVARTIDGGARIYTLRSGWIDATNRRMYVSTEGHRAATEIDTLKERRDIGMRGLVKRGLPTTGRVLHAYRVVRNELGRAQRLEVANPQFYDDVWTLLVVERVAFADMGTILYERFGYTRADGKPYHDGYIYQQIHTPTFWGHSARHYTNRPDSHPTELAWVFDTSLDPPDGVELFRNTHPPVWEGEKGARAILELQRRKVLQPGSHAYATHRFAGLFLCAECGHMMLTRIHYYKETVRRAVFCKSRYAKHHPTTCSQTISVKYDALQAAVDDSLRKAYAAGGVDVFFGAMLPQSIDNTEALKREVAELEANLTQLLSMPLQSDAGQRVREAQIQRIDARLSAVQRDLEKVDRMKPREAAFDFAQLTQYVNDEKFWDQPDGLINARLHALMGNWRYVIRDGEVVSVMPRPARNRQKRRRFS